MSHHPIPEVAILAVVTVLAFFGGRAYERLGEREQRRLRGEFPRPLPPATPRSIERAARAGRLKLELALRKVNSPVMPSVQDFDEEKTR